MGGAPLISRLREINGAIPINPHAAGWMMGIAIMGVNAPNCSTHPTAADPFHVAFADLQPRKQSNRFHRGNTLNRKRSDYFRAAAIFLKRSEPEPGIQFQNVSDSAQGHWVAARAWCPGRLAQL
jgi:hypothetical protein